VLTILYQLKGERRRDTVEYKRFLLLPLRYRFGADQFVYLRHEDTTSAGRNIKNLHR